MTHTSQPKCATVIAAHKPTRMTAIAPTESITPQNSQPAEVAVTNSKMPTKLLVPAAEAAQMLSIGRSTFWNKVKENKLPQPMRFAGLTRWRVSDLQQFVEHSIPSTPALESAQNQ